MEAKKEIEIPEPNGSLMLAWQVKNRHVLLIGGGEVATSRVKLLLQANAKITIVSPEVSEEIEEFNALGLLHAVIKRKYELSDLTMYERLQQHENQDQVELQLTDTPSECDFKKLEDVIYNKKFALVLTAIPDHELSRIIFYNCKILNLQVNIADRPSICDFYFGAMYRKGSLQIMISSNGKSPRFTRKLKDEKLKPTFDNLNVEKAVENLGSLRQSLRDDKLKGDDNVTIKKRMEWNKVVTDIFSIEEWGSFDNTIVEKILNYYPQYPPKNIQELI
ncbi:hypothetical protein PACTADRAFT_60513 [Pachysolen tannophilus NRRL Y-2460]|uniref:precorrin-2 dehydrogenase n=1 Tax=Pachysolen tannophilus NRRL Y-2460 TaxID=669874 RepID=A0A1E4TRH8_PACTA|nr:hypothetical protein PACTADRAFT_60513 [Pachysolen tannophilus NRRL Y-2460]